MHNHLFSRAAALALAAAALITACKQNPTSSAVNSENLATPLAKPGGGGGGGTTADPAIADCADTVISRQVDPAIWVMNADGSNRTAVYNPSTKGTIVSVSKPRWSPDGKHIVFVQGYVWKTGDISVVNNVPTMTNVTAVLDPTGTSDTYFETCWNPDRTNNVIACIRYNNVDTTSKIETVPAAGGTPTVVYTAAAGHRVQYITYNPSGTQVAVAEADLSVAPPKSYINVYDMSNGTLVYSRDVSSLTGGRAIVAYLDWARTAGSTTVCFGSGGNIYTVDVAGTNTWTNVVTGTYCAWSPDDTKILFQNSNGLNTITLSTGTVKTILSSSGIWNNWRRF